MCKDCNLKAQAWGSSWFLLAQRMKFLSALTVWECTQNLWPGVRKKRSWQKPTGFVPEAKLDIDCGRYVADWGWSYDGVTRVSFADLTPLFFVHCAKTEAIYARFWGLPCRYLFAIPTIFDVALFPMHLDQPAGSGLFFSGFGPATGDVCCRFSFSCLYALVYPFVCNTAC